MSSNGPTRFRLCLLVLVAASAWLAPAASARVNPQVAGLQVALRAYRLYAGPIDGIFGPATLSAVASTRGRRGSGNAHACRPPKPRAAGGEGGPRSQNQLGAARADAARLLGRPLQRRPPPRSRCRLDGVWLPD